MQSLQDMKLSRRPETSPGYLEARGEQVAPAEFTRLERKFAIDPGKAGYVVAWLRQRVAPDRLHPCGVVNSVYYDTPDLASYYNSVDGYFDKNKIRIRWYDNPQSDQMTPVFVELKDKQGYTTHKRRHEYSLPGHALQERALPSTLRKLDIEHALLRLGHRPPPHVRPVILIRYRRYRFTELMTRTGVSYDYDISSRVLDPRFSDSRGELTLRTSVVELKGSVLSLPPMLRGLQDIVSGWTAFSKYALCLQSHLERAGSYGWLTQPVLADI